MQGFVVRVALAAALVLPAVTTAAPASAAPRTTVTTEAYVASQPVPLAKHVYAGWDGSTLNATAKVTYPRFESRVRGTWESTVKVGRTGQLLSVFRDVSYVETNPLASTSPVLAGYVIEYRWRNAWRRADRIEQAFAVTGSTDPTEPRSESHYVTASVARSFAGRTMPVRLVVTAAYAGGLLDLDDELVVMPPGAAAVVVGAGPR
jgi:hypothetical protein